jgi:flagellar biosynthesis/type III secretory pathway M-ring protein FliF/YscJ
MIGAAATAVIVLADEEEFDPNSVTPGIWGFVITFLLMVVVVLLVLDMVRRIRRTNYRAQVREQLEAEARDAELAEADGQVTDAADEGPATDGPGRLPGDDERPDEASGR